MTATTTANRIPALTRDKAWEALDTIDRRLSETFSLTYLARILAASEELSRTDHGDALHLLAEKIEEAARESRALTEALVTSLPACWMTASQ